MLLVNFKWRFYTLFEDYLEQCKKLFSPERSTENCVSIQQIFCFLDFFFNSQVPKTCSFLFCISVITNRYMFTRRPPSVFRSIRIPKETSRGYSDTANRNQNHFVTIFIIKCNRNLKHLNMQSESLPCV